MSVFNHNQLFPNSANKKNKFSNSVDFVIKTTTKECVQEQNITFKNENYDEMFNIFHQQIKTRQ